MHIWGEKKLLVSNNSVAWFFCSVEDENLVIPELHVTSMVGNELLSESFETGLQMLQTLERQQWVFIEFKLINWWFLERLNISTVILPN